ncbi:hypothetical protein COXBURSA331_A1961 [Coxiella burnetii RSA 331]|nr:hypothetical protein COXBURSA331_A1961 [Coxiella burnetii RSA 331]
MNLFLAWYGAMTLIVRLPFCRQESIGPLIQSMALYEKIKRLNGMNAYCYYTIFGSLVGLYNVNYRNDLGKEWTWVFPGYICNQAAGNCQFIHK